VLLRLCLFGSIAQWQGQQQPHHPFGRKAFTKLGAKHGNEKIGKGIRQSQKQ
jgi:hypothetical protein